MSLAEIDVLQVCACRLQINTAYVLMLLVLSWDSAPLLCDFDPSNINVLNKVSHQGSQYDLKLCVDFFQLAFCP